MYIFLMIIIVGACLTQIADGADQVTQVRVEGGSSNGTGRLEILFNGQWGTVYGYSTYFTQNDARVACRMLGYENSGVVYIFSDSNNVFGPGSGSVINHRFNCRGNESDLTQCGSSSWSVSSSTSHNYDVGISCELSLEATKLRLMDGDTAQSGRVEFYFKGQWTSICDTNFGNEEARTICNILGYKNTGIAKAFSGSHFGQGAGEISLSNLRCTGSETDIKYCSGSWGNNNCNHKKDAGVNCDSTPIRLVNGPNNSSGRVEIHHGGQWGTICGDYSQDFDTYDVKIICKMLGIYTPGAFGYSSAFYGEGNGIIIVRNLNCDGTESDIAQCQSDRWSVNNEYVSSCGHTRDAGVNCAGRTDIRLADGISEQSGRVEIYHNGHWGTVGDANFDNHDLAVICRMLGYEYSSRSYFMKGSYYGRGIGEVIVSGLGCNGAEADIGLCTARWWPATKDQRHDHDVGVNCDGDVPIRLVEGESNGSGRVEVFHDGNYGTVCKRSFDQPDLIVVCHMLGFDNIPKSAYWRSASTYAQGLGEIVVSDLNCNGIEDSIGQCSGQWPANIYCTHADDVYVNCNGDPEKVRLADGPNVYSGRVEVLYSGQWGTICDNFFDRSDAVVICRMLGFSNPEKAVAYSRAKYGSANDSTPFVLSQLHCNGLETNLGQCNPEWNPTCRHYQDAGVDCCPHCQDAIIG